MMTEFLFPVYKWTPQKSELTLQIVKSQNKRRGSSPETPCR